MQNPAFTRRLLDETASNDQQVEDEIAADAAKEIARRMIINNNMSEMRRLAVENKIEGEKVSTATKAEENSSKTDAGKEMVIQQASEDKSKSASKKGVVCVNKGGKKISDSDMGKFLDLLEKLKAAQKVSNVVISSE